MADGTADTVDTGDMADTVMNMDMVMDMGTVMDTGTDTDTDTAGLTMATVVMDTTMMTGGGEQPDSYKTNNLGRFLI